MAIPMPASMPCTLIEGHVQQEADIAETCEFEAGEARRAPIFTTVPNLVQVAWRFESQAAFDDYVDWFEDDLQAGALPFELPIAEQGGTGAIVVDALFIAPPRERRLPGGRWRVEAGCVTGVALGGTVAAVWDADTGFTLSSGNRVASVAAAASQHVRTTVARTTGKRYVEIVLGLDGSDNCDFNVGVSADSNGAAISGQRWSRGTGESLGGGTAAPAALVSGAVLGLALDFDAGSGAITIDNVSAATMTWTAGAARCVACNVDNDGVQHSFTLAAALTYAPPSGYTAGL